MADELDKDMDLSSDFLTLMDEDGEEHLFEVLDTIQLKTGRYLAMIPHFEDSPEALLEDDAELIIMKVVEDDGNEEGEYLEAVEDEKEFNAVSAIFAERLEDEYDIEYPDEEDTVEN